MDTAIANIQKEMNKGTDFRSFLSSIDHMNQLELDKLVALTGSLLHAKAILLKMSNLMVGKYQYQNRHEYLVSNPFGLIADTSNICPLRCPGCIHNQYCRESKTVDWPLVLLDEDTFSRFLRKFGPYGTHFLFYNWGEPLLNKKTPQYVRMAKQYMLRTNISSNLSVKFDAEALVESGLDYLIMSIDGATPESYNRYRKGGDFGLVMENVKKLVRAKEKLNSTSPYLNWRFLTFEHNAQEIEQAKKMAEDIGVDEIMFAVPYDVQYGDPTIKVYDKAPGGFAFKRPSSGVNIGLEKMTDNISLDIEKAFGEKWSSRLPSAPKSLFKRNSGSTCKWLYKTIVMDANGRILPCCYVPLFEDKYEYIYSPKEDETCISHFNSKSYCVSRQFLSDPRRKKRRDVGARSPYCTVCKDKTTPLTDAAQVRFYFQGYCFGSLPQRTFNFSESTIESLAEWDAIGELDTNFRKSVRKCFEAINPSYLVDRYLRRII